MKQARFDATLPARDMKRARDFYAQKLGLEPAEETSDGLLYSGGQGSRFLLFESSGSPSGSHTQMSFEVDDLEGEVADLKQRGVKFEEYDQPGFKTVNSIAQIGETKGAWFKDSEGNLLSIGTYARVGAAR